MNQLTPDSRLPEPGEADPHFGTDEEMLAWCERENLTPVKDRFGEWDWQAVWEIHMTRDDPSLTSGKSDSVATPIPPANHPD